MELVIGYIACMAFVVLVFLLLGRRAGMPLEATFTALFVAMAIVLAPITTVCIIVWAAMGAARAFKEGV
jgi:hypothetical protein